MASIVDMLSYRLVDIATHFNTVPIGTYHATSNFTVALPTWQRLSEEERLMIVKAANRAKFDLTDRWAFQLPADARDAAALPPAAREEVRASYAELRSIAAAITDPLRTVTGQPNSPRYRMVPVSAIVEMGMQNFASSDG